MTFQTPEPLPCRRPARTAVVRSRRLRAHVPVAFIDFSHIAWDGHDLVVISKYDVILD
jgi:hypothetical protein